MAITVTGQAELQALILKFQKWSSNKAVLSTVDSGLDQLGKAMVADVRARVMATPSRGENKRRGRRSLRASIARATESRRQHLGESAVLTVQVDPEEMPLGQGSLASLYEGLSVWKHPVYGHEPLVKQTPHPYFGPATENAEKDAMIVAEAGIDKIADDLEG
jgi:hypothetical protein